MHVVCIGYIQIQFSLVAFWCLDVAQENNFLYPPHSLSKSQTEMTVLGFPPSFVTFLYSKKLYLSFSLKTNWINERLLIINEFPRSETTPAKVEDDT